MDAVVQGEWSSVAPEIARASAALMREAALLNGLARTLVADAVASEDGDDFAFGDIDIDAVKDLHFAVSGAQRPHLKHAWSP